MIGQLYTPAVATPGKETVYEEGVGVGGKVTIKNRLEKCESMEQNKHDKYIQMATFCKHKN